MGLKHKTGHVFAHDPFAIRMSGALGMTLGGSCANAAGRITPEADVIKEHQRAQQRAPPAAFHQSVCWRCRSSGRKNAKWVPMLVDFWPAPADPSKTTAGGSYDLRSDANLIGALHDGLLIIGVLMSTIRKTLRKTHSDPRFRSGLDNPAQKHHHPEIKTPALSGIQHKGGCICFSARGRSTSYSAVII